MGLYRRYVLPALIDVAMRSKVVRVERARYVPAARGEVLEIGVGSGLNIPIYGPQVRKLHALDPSPELLRMARRRARGAAFPVELLSASAEAIPLSGASVDTVVATWTLCTIPDPVRALREMRRVLRPGGRLVVIEHGRAPEPGVARWQDRLTPLWRRIAGGCHLNRAIDQLLEQGGFEAAGLECGYVMGPRLIAYFYRGAVRPAPIGV